MAVDTARVVQVFASGSADSVVGSGYAVADRLVLTARHVLANAGRGAVGDPAEVCGLDAGDWQSAHVAWADPEHDVALLKVDDPWPESPQTAALRWGRLVGGDPVTAAAVGYPWAQERPGGRRDTDHVVGFVPPAAGLVSGHLQLTVLSAAPIQQPGAPSPWAGMSGAGLVVGPWLVGVVLADPAKYGTDRLVAVPVSRLLAAPGFQDVLGTEPDLVDVGSKWRLEYAAGRSVTLRAPYRPLPPGITARQSPTRLLYPEHRLVPFGDRDGLVEELTGWCDRAGPGLSLRTVTGTGGSGKTRLAAEVCVAMAGRGWDAGFADPADPGGTVRWTLDRPTLLAVDDADLNQHLTADLVASLAYAGVRVRLLLLARSRTPWWRQLDADTDGLAEGFDAGDLPLSDHPLDLAARVAHYHGAYAALAPYLAAGGPAEQPEPPQLADDAFGDPLMVHLSALLAATGDPLASGRESSSGMREKVLRAVLDREAERWPRQLRSSEGISEPMVVLRRCVATATVSAPVDEAAGDPMLTAVPDLVGGAAVSSRRSLARWLHRLQSGDGYWNPLRPDPLADQLLGDLDVLPDLSVAVADLIAPPADPTGPTSRRPAVGGPDRLLAELTRAAAAGGGHAGTALQRLMDTRLEPLLAAALADPTGPLPGRLVAALVVAPAPAEAARLIDRLPERSVALTDLAHILALQTVTHCRSLADHDLDAYLPDLADAVYVHSIRLAQLRRWEDALESGLEALQHYQSLAETQPAQFTPGLAKALNSLSNRLADVARWQDALRAVNEALRHYRALAAAQPDAFRYELVKALHNQARALAALGRGDEALAAIDACVGQCRVMARAEKDVPSAALAKALNTRSNRLAELGRPVEALAAAEEAVGHYRALAEARPDAFLPDLAEALYNQAGRLAELGRSEDALTAVQEAVGHFRALAEARPDPILPELAESLCHQSSRLAELGRGGEALTAAQEAVEHYRALVAARPEALLPDLAMALRNLGAHRAQQEDYVQAMQADLEAVEIYQELDRRRPGSHADDLDAAARSLVVDLLDLGYADEGSDQALANALRLRPARDVVAELTGANTTAPAPKGSARRGSSCCGAQGVPEGRR